ncbi:small ribosomal subunit protein eS25-like [Aegilops tauschii subsp. strangulata]|nr:40S ribosomal protein S25-like [Aegilops tauschii subsp. strangulata]
MVISAQSEVVALMGLIGEGVVPGIGLEENISLLFGVSNLAVKKDSKAAASSSSAKHANAGSGKQQQKKKKWSKGKQKEKLSNAVLFDQATYDKMLSEAPKYKLVTPSVLSERLRINASLAKRGIKDLMARGLVREVSLHASQQIFTRATNVPSS